VYLFINNLGSKVLLLSYSWARFFCLLSAAYILPVLASLTPPHQSILIGGYCGERVYMLPASFLVLGVGVLLEWPSLANVLNHKPYTIQACMVYGLFNSSYIVYDLVIT
jgi:hypothetical protein